MILFRSVLHNIGVVAVGFAVAYLGAQLDHLLRIARFHVIVAIASGWLLVAAGFPLRAWATWCFYENRMRVISLVPQATLVTTGPYRVSRSPLYLGSAFWPCGLATLWRVYFAAARARAGGHAAATAAAARNWRRV